MLPYRTRTTRRSDAFNALDNVMGAKAFDATIDLSNMTNQSQSPLFKTLPVEIRTEIFELACTSSNDGVTPYPADRVYHRPGYKFRQKVEIALLQTCKRVFAETRLMPVSQAEHTFWIFGGPFRSLRDQKHALGNFAGWQSALNEEQQAAVDHVHLFIQQMHLEQMGTRNMMSELKFKARVFTLTFRHSDWWSWESPPESTDRLGICPWLPNRVSHQEMIAQPLEPTVEQMKATMIKGTWGWQIGQITGLEVLRIEFETDIVKKDQLEVVLTSAKHWIFPLHGANAVLECDDNIRVSEWTGQAHLKRGNTPNLRHVAPPSEIEPAVPMRTYYVAEMTWKKRSQKNTKEMA